ncbi:MAG: glycosyltransferase family 4 protein [Verrucomicrobia bacterium]|nr:glycosyltransferase family 4 protein [Verrucomicrobiota bacterium]
MQVLHTESSNGWGGQEIRILREAIGMRDRGHEIIFAIVKGGKLAQKAREAGFVVYELDFRRRSALFTIARLHAIIRRHNIHLVNTHSSLDAWLGGIAARLAGRHVLRTRHLSTPIRPGLNSRLLYKTLADGVATTSSAIIPMITAQAGIPSQRCRCIPTGVEPITVAPEEAAAFRESIGVRQDQILVGTACVVRSWKGIRDLMRAAEILKDDTRLKWVVVGGGYLDQYQGSPFVTFTGHLDNPFPAIAAMDVFMLLSTGHEGISQATLQASWLKKPLITTTVGGLPEVCIDKETGFLVPPASPGKVAEAVLKLASDKALRESLGKNARKHVEDHFLFTHTLNEMELLWSEVTSN